MARVSKAVATTVRAAVARTAATASGPPIEVAFKHVVRHGGQEVSFDLDVRGGVATELDIVSPFLPERSLYEDNLLSPATTEMRGVRISTERPLLLLGNAGGLVASVQVDLASGKPRVIGTPEGPIRVR
jgi:hypothetical protein